MDNLYVVCFVIKKWEVRDLSHTFTIVYIILYLPGMIAGFFYVFTLIFLILYSPGVIAGFFYVLSCYFWVYMFDRGFKRYLVVCAGLSFFQ